MNSVLDSSDSTSLSITLIAIIAEKVSMEGGRNVTEFKARYKKRQQRLYTAVKKILDGQKENKISRKGVFSWLTL